MTSCTKQADDSMMNSQRPAASIYAPTGKGQLIISAWQLYTGDTYVLTAILGVHQLYWVAQSHQMSQND
jgi:hypothetical protein